MRPLVILSLILIGCTQQDQNVGAIHGIDPTFQSYYDSFGAVYGTKVSIPIGFVSMPETIAGDCTRYSNGYKDIEINPIYWASANEDARTVLIYHELGHCVFNRLHNWNVFPDGCPFSIMEYYDFGDPCFLAHKNDYVTELPYSEPGDHL